VLLNNDIRVRDDSLSVLLPHCAAPDVFAVSAVLLNAEGTAIMRSRTVIWLLMGKILMKTSA
jgi:hypothetical protein